MVNNNDELGKNAIILAYRLVDDILYFDDIKRTLRLCIPSNIKTEVFRLAHDEMGYPGYTRIHERLNDALYFRKMVTEFHEFIRHCPKYQIDQTPKYRFYGSLQPIFPPVRLFYTFTIDFILVLPILIKNFNCAMTVTDKFNKTLTHIIGITSWLTR